jgi:hypothetical protein
LSIDGKSKIQKSCRCMWVFQAFGSRRLMVDGHDSLWGIYQSTLPLLGLRCSIIFPLFVALPFSSRICSRYSVAALRNFCTRLQNTERWVQY